VLSTFASKKATPIAARSILLEGGERAKFATGRRLLALADESDNNNDKGIETNRIQKVVK
jgi:hypothetical protein